MSFVRYIRGFLFQTRQRLRGWNISRQVIGAFKETAGYGPRIVLVGSPLHGNLGDHAIALAMRRFFEDKFSGRPVVEIPGALFSDLEIDVVPLVKSGDCITVIGGGFLGTLWLHEEEMVRSIVRAFPNNRIVIFPQTVFFDSSEGGGKEIAVTRDLYQTHQDLHLLVRDFSIRFVEENFVGKHFQNVRGAPDIVLYMDRSAFAFIRSGILLCFRSDKEKALSESLVSELEAQLSSRGEFVRRTDTVCPYGVSLRSREDEVNNKLNEFGSSRLVITDRLHGMIFAAITGTPCIALNNSSGKVGGVWALWLKHLPYIKFIENESDMSSLLNEMLAMGTQRYDPLPFTSCWNKITHVIVHGSRK